MWHGDAIIIGRRMTRRDTTEMEAKMYDREIACYILVVAISITVLVMVVVVVEMVV